jgi:hypothetical protein
MSTGCSERLAGASFGRSGVIGFAIQLDRSGSNRGRQ